MNAEQIWQAALGELQMQMTKATFDTWLKRTAVLSYADQELVIACPNQYTPGVAGQPLEDDDPAHPVRHHRPIDACPIRSLATDRTSPRTR